MRWVCVLSCAISSAWALSCASSVRMASASATGAGVCVGAGCSAATGAVAAAGGAAASGGGVGAVSDAGAGGAGASAAGAEAGAAGFGAALPAGGVAGGCFSALMSIGCVNCRIKMHAMPRTMTHPSFRKGGAAGGVEGGVEEASSMRRILAFAHPFVYGGGEVKCIGLAAYDAIFPWQVLYCARRRCADGDCARGA